MAIRDILRLGDPRLLARAQSVADPASSDIITLIKDMKDTLANARGAGLAAPQIGVLKRVILISVPEERIIEEPGATPIPVTVLINPLIEPDAHSNGGPMEKGIEDGWEGCLSIPGLRGVVPRHKAVSYRATDENGQPVSGRATGFHARVLQHECDHLDGILYPMRMNDLKWLSFTDQLDKGLAEAAAVRRDSAGSIA